MDDFKGTSGPWHWDEEGLGNKNHIVLGKEYPAEMTSKANKALITAAPELLQALQEMAKMLDAAGCESATVNAHKIIAKALGKE